MALPVSVAGLPPDAPLTEVARLFAPIALAPREVVLFAHFDPKWRLLGMRHIASQARDATAVRLRHVVLDTLAFESHLVVMAHNHPSGDSTPSAADHALTRRVARALQMLDVRLIEHLVLAPGRLASFREQGLL